MRVAVQRPLHNFNFKAFSAHLYTWVSSIYMDDSLSYLVILSLITCFEMIQGRSQGGARGAIAPPFFWANATALMFGESKHERRRTRFRGEQWNQANYII